MEISVATIDLRMMRFKDWKAANPDIEEVFTKCGACYGTGEHECDCGDVHECRECSGDGKIVHVSLRELYERQLAEDKEKVRKWMRMFEGMDPHK